MITMDEAVRAMPGTLVPTCGSCLGCRGGGGGRVGGAGRPGAWGAVTRCRALPRAAVGMIPLCLGEAPALAWPAIPPSPCAGRDLPPWLQMRAAEPGAGEGGQVGGGGHGDDGEAGRQ